MKKLIFIISFMITAVSYGQVDTTSQDPPVVVCGSDGEFLEDKKIERLISQRRIVKAYEDGSLDENTSAQIPVVYHIIWGTTDAGSEIGKIPVEQVKTSITSLHDAFRNQGIHYDPFGYDTNINFCEEGIYYHDIRDLTSDPETIRQYLDHGVAHSGTNGISRLWVAQACKENAGLSPSSENRLHLYSTWRISSPTSNGIVGFAAFNGNPLSHSQGSFMRSTYVGDVRYRTPTDPPFQIVGTENKTVIHEVGHNLALYHTFQGQSCNPETNCNAQGDRICDTPPQTTQRSCLTGSCGFVSMNFMDYLHQTCRDRFTPGQTDRMYMSLLAHRPNWLNGNLCGDVVTPPGDVYGCMDATANNYNPRATIDDGSCKYDTEPNGPIVGNLNYLGDKGENPVLVLSFAKQIESYDGPYITVRDGAYREYTVDNTFCTEDGSTCLIELLKTQRLMVKRVYSQVGSFVAESLVDREQPELKIDDKGYPYIHFDTEDDKLVVRNLQVREYSIFSVVNFTEPLADVRSIFSKRSSVSASELFAFTWSNTQNQLNWDHDVAKHPGNRVVLKWSPTLNQTYALGFVAGGSGWRYHFRDGLVRFQTSANSGKWNPKILIIGNDGVTPTRGMGGRLYEFLVFGEEIDKDVAIDIQKSQKNLYPGFSWLPDIE